MSQNFSRLMINIEATIIQRSIILNEKFFIYYILYEYILLQFHIKIL